MGEYVVNSEWLRGVQDAAEHAEPDYDGPVEELISSVIAKEVLSQAAEPRKKEVPSQAAESWKKEFVFVK